jgi:hypothetical protein
MRSIKQVKYYFRLSLTITEQYNLLFREDSFAVNILNRVLFDPIGVQYIRTLIEPALQSICKLSNPLQVTNYLLIELIFFID